MQNTLKYKNYLGSIEFSTHDNLFYGKVLEIKDLVSFQGTDLKTLEESFKQAVDDYIQNLRLIHPDS